MRKDEKTNRKSVVFCPFSELDLRKPPLPLLRSKKNWIWGARRRRKKFGVEITQNVQKHVFFLGGGGVGKKSDFQIFGVLKKAPPPLLGTKIFKGRGFLNSNSPDPFYIILGIVTT